MPYLVLFEALEPLVEILGFAIVITLVILHAENWSYVVAFFLIATLIGGRPGWSTIPRGATLEQPTQAVAP